MAGGSSSRVLSITGAAPGTVAGSLYVPEVAGRDSMDALAAYRCEREVLIVLDCEQSETLGRPVLPHVPRSRLAGSRRSSRRPKRRQAKRQTTLPSSASAAHDCKAGSMRPNRSSTWPS